MSPNLGQDCVVELLKLCNLDNFDQSQDPLEELLAIPILKIFGQESKKHRITRQIEIGKKEIGSKDYRKNVIR